MVSSAATSGRLSLVGYGRLVASNVPLRTTVSYLVVVEVVAYVQVVPLVTGLSEHQRPTMTERKPQDDDRNGALKRRSPTFKSKGFYPRRVGN